MLLMPPVGSTPPLLSRSYSVVLSSTSTPPRSASLIARSLASGAGLPPMLSISDCRKRLTTMPIALWASRANQARPALIELAGCRSAGTLPPSPWDAWAEGPLPALVRESGSRR